LTKVRRHKARSRAETASAPPEPEDGPETRVVDAAARVWRKKQLTAVPEGTPKARLRSAPGRLHAELRIGMFPAGLADAVALLAEETVTDPPPEPRSDTLARAASRRRPGVAFRPCPAV